MTEREIILFIAIVLAAAIVFIILYFVLDKFFFGKFKCKKILSALERKYEYLHALLTGQDYQYVQRIEVISRTNLTYTDVYSENLKHYKSIRENEEVKYLEVLNDLIQLLDNSDIKGFKKYYRDAAQTIIAYEAAVNNFNSQLMSVIKPEEEARQNSLALKEQLRDVKSKYASIEGELEFVSETFEKIFKTIDERFEKFESLVETADYEEANSMLPEIKNVLNASQMLIEKVPTMLKRANEIIPQELEESVEHYTALMAREFQLKHINFDRVKFNIEGSLNKIRDDIKALSIKDVPERLDAIEAELVVVNEAFAKEEAAAEEFDNNSERIYEEFSNISNEFIKVRNAMPKYQTYYIVNKVHSEELRGIQVELDQVLQDKRRLDMYLHSAEKTAFTVLVVKMRELEAGTQHLVERFNLFKDYLASLKTDTENGYKVIHDSYFKLKEREQDLRNFFNEDYMESYSHDFNKSYEQIDTIYSILNKKPINVDDANAQLNELNERTESIFTRVLDAKRYREEALEEMQFLNRDRVKFNDVNIQLNQAENLFLNGEYSRAFQMTEEIKERSAQKDILQ